MGPIRPSPECVQQRAGGALVHPAALCESEWVGTGTRIWAFAHVMHGAIIGCDCNVGEHAFIESGAVIGDRVTIKNGVMIWDGVTIQDEAFIGPGVLFTNDRYPRSPRAGSSAQRYAHPENWREPTVVEAGASIGAGAVILCGCTIGSYAVVGAGAVVIQPVSAHQIVVGHPAKPVGWACRCGRPVQTGESCRVCGQTLSLRGEGRLSQENGLV